MQNCNSLFSQRAGGQGYFKVSFNYKDECFQRIPGLVWACRACKHQVCYPETILICCMPRVPGWGWWCLWKVVTDVQRMTMAQVRSTLLLETIQYLIAIAGLSLHVCSGYISHQTSGKSLDWITMFVIVIFEAGMRSSSSLKSKVLVQLHFSVGFMVISC